MMENISPENTIEKERGANVTIDVIFMRHGERGLDGQLTDYGREMTRDVAQRDKSDFENYDAVKPGGSDAGRDPRTGTGRARETATIYADEVAGSEAYHSTPSKDRHLNYEHMLSRRPYDHVEKYNEFLPCTVEEFERMSDKEKAEVSKIAQEKTMDYAASLKDPETQKVWREAAGAYATVVLHYMEQTQKLKSNSRVARIEGVHGGTGEWLLQKALVWKDENGNEHTGFDTFGDIGGPLNPSEAFAVRVQTDHEGEVQKMCVFFKNPDRPQGEMHLDMDKMKELSAFYKELHKKDNTL